MKYPALNKPTIPLHPLVQGLGWFSLGLGLAELLMPRQVSRGAGMHKQDSLLRGYGLREIATGLGILLSRNPRPWLWGRVAGDVVDVATVAATADPRKKPQLGISSIALLGVGLLDLYSAFQSAPKRPALRQARTHDYRSRSGFPRKISEMRGLVARNKGRQQAAQPKMHAAE